MQPMQEFIDFYRRIIIKMKGVLKMTDQQLHEMAMLALSKIEFNTANNPAELAAEIFQHYNSVMGTLIELNNGVDNVCVIDAFGTPSGACANK